MHLRITLLVFYCLFSVWGFSQLKTIAAVKATALKLSASEKLISLTWEIELK